MPAFLTQVNRRVVWGYPVGVARGLAVLIGPSRKRGMKGAGTGWGHYVTRMPRASKLVGLVKPWAVRRRTWSRLLMPSMRPLEACGCP